MDDLNFTNESKDSKTVTRSIYSAGAALKFFKSVSNEQDIAAGKIIFEEETKENRLLLQRDKMYLLVKGLVELTVKGKPLGVVKQGEIFGEMATLTQAERSATASAKTSCRIIALDDREFRTALQGSPEFALTLMSLMSRRLRRLIAEMNAAKVQPDSEEWNEIGRLDKKILALLVSKLGDKAHMRYAQDKLITQEGKMGIMMFVVLEGLVSVSIQGAIVEKIGPGGMFGEMALIEHTERLASATAETECVLLAINRDEFLELVKGSPEFGMATLKMISERAKFLTGRHAQ